MTVSTVSMNFGLDDEREAIVRWGRDFVDRSGGLAYGRALRDGTLDVGASYHQMSDAGFTSMGLKGDGSRLDRALVCEQLGAGLIWSPFFEASVLTGALAASEDKVLAQIVDGAIVSTTAPDLLAQPIRLAADGTMPAVEFRSPWLGVATHVMLPLAEGTGCVDRIALVPRERFVVSDGGHYMASVPILQAKLAASSDLSADSILLVGRDDWYREAVTDFLGALAAFCVGAAQRAIDIAADYAKERVQFGRAIGSFQAQQHKLADALLHTRQARQLTYAAAVRDKTDRVLAASGAFRLAAKAFSQAGLTGSLVHGGYGLTLEYDIHLYFIYSKLIEVMYGRVAQRLLVDAIRSEDR